MLNCPNIGTTKIDTLNLNSLKIDTLKIDSLKIEKWTGDNFRAVNKFYRSQKHKGSASGLEQVFVIYQHEDIIAAVRLVPHDGYHWLRSLYVKTELRGQQLGSLLLKAVHDSINEPIYCFPFDHLLAFYEASGYQLLAEDDMPEALQDLYKRYSRKGTAIINMGIHLP